MRSAEPLVRVVRSGLEESVHLGARRGLRRLRPAASPRSATPIASRSSGPARSPSRRACRSPRSADRRVPDRLVAIMCASHNGEPVHIRAVRDVLRRGGLTEDDLRTPPARPSDPASASRVREPAPVFHNCSGKHAGMLLACASRGWDTPTVPDALPSAPAARALGRSAAFRRSMTASIGVDGCGVPVHGMPLRAIATMYARLADADRQGSLGARGWRGRRRRCAPSPTWSAAAIASTPRSCGRRRTSWRRKAQRPWTARCRCRPGSASR